MKTGRIYRYIGEIAAMLKPNSRPANIDQLRTAIASMGEEAPLLQLLMAELDATRPERDALRRQKHSDKLEIKRLTLLLDKLKGMLFGRRSEKLLRQIEQLELELEEAYISEGVRKEKPKPVRPRPASRVTSVNRFPTICRGKQRSTCLLTSNVRTAAAPGLHLLRSGGAGGGLKPTDCPKLCGASATRTQHDLEVSGSFTSVPAGTDLRARRCAAQ